MTQPKKANVAVNALIQKTLNQARENTSQTAQLSSNHLYPYNRNANSVYKSTRSLQYKIDRSDINEVNAYIALSRSNVDTDKLQHYVKKFKVAATDMDSLHAPEGDIDCFLNHHNNAVVQSVINNSKRNCELDTVTSHQRWEASVWERFCTENAQKAASAQAWVIEPSREVPVACRINNKPSDKYVSSIFDAFQMMAGSNNKSRQSSDPVASCLPATAFHDIFSNICTDSVNDKMLRNVSLSSVDEANSMSDILAMIKLIAREDGDHVVPAGYFAPMTLSSSSPFQLTNAINDGSYEFNAGLIKYFGDHTFYNDIISKIGADSTSASASFDKSIFREAIVRYTEHSNYPELCHRILTQDKVPLWPFVYNCLKVGACGLALEALGSANESEEVNYVKTLLQFVRRLWNSDYNHNSTNNSYNISEGVAVEIDNSLRWARNRYRQLKQIGGDPFLRTLLNLLCAANSDDFIIDGLDQTVEDILWFHALFAQIYEEIRPFNYSRQLTKPIPIRDFVREAGGEDYFDENRTNPLFYAFVLIAAKDFAGAIAHLYESKKFMLALILTTISLYYGFILPHTELPSNNMSNVMQASNIILQCLSDPRFQNSLLTVIDLASLLDSCWQKRPLDVDKATLESHQTRSIQSIEFTYKTLVAEISKLNASDAKLLQEHFAPYLNKQQLEQILRSVAADVSGDPIAAMDLFDKTKMVPDLFFTYIRAICNMIPNNGDSGKFEEYLRVGEKYAEKYAQELSGLTSYPDLKSHVETFLNLHRFIVYTQRRDTNNAKRLYALLGLVPRAAKNVGDAWKRWYSLTRTYCSAPLALNVLCNFISSALYLWKGWYDECKALENRPDQREKIALEIERTKQEVDAIRVFMQPQKETLEYVEDINKIARAMGI